MIIIDVDNYSFFDIGEKASRLFELKEKGFDGPNLFCVNTKHIFRKTFDRYLENNFSDIEYLSVRPSIYIDEDCENKINCKVKSRLNVTKDELCKVIEECYNEFYAIEGVEEHSEEIKMSLVIQEMINFDTTGVLFTSNPQGIVNEKVILVGKDNEEIITDEKIPITTYYYNDTSKQYYYESESNSYLLDEESFKELIQLGDKLVELIGKYFVAEFVIDEGKITILQLKALTVLDEKDLLVLDNSDILENYPGITLPLTYSFIKGTYSGAFKNLVTRLTPLEEVSKLEYVYSDILEIANGRIYYQLSNLKLLVSTLPFSEKIESVWKSMNEVENKKFLKSENEFWGIKSLHIYYNLVKEFIEVNTNIEGLDFEFGKIRDYFNSTYDENLSNQVLIEIYDEVNAKALTMWGISIINDIYTYTFKGLLTARLKRRNKNYYEAIINDYVADINSIVRMKPTNELIEMTNYLVKNKKINKLKRFNKDNIDEYLKTKGKTQKLLNQYINEYGDRDLDDSKLESDTYRSSPILLINKVLEYAEKIENQTLTVKHRDEKPINSRDWQARFFSKKLIKGLNNQEVSKLSRGRYFGISRRVFLNIGKNLVDSGDIEDTRDIFYLFIEEIRDFVNGVDLDLREIVSKRKDEYVLYYDLPDYSRLVFAGEVFNKQHKNINGVEVGAPVLGSED